MSELALGVLVGGGLGLAGSLLTNRKSPKRPSLPTRADPAVEEARKRRLAAARAATGRRKTILAGAGDEGPVTTQSATVLGG